MSEKTIGIVCPRCNHAWDQDPTLLGKPDQVVYREISRHKRKETYCLCCSECGTYIYVDIEVVEEDDG